MFFKKKNPMASFVKKIIYYGTTTIILSFLAYMVFPPPNYWGNQDYTSKIEKFRLGKYNTAFIGSSRMLTGFSPFLFDSLMNTNTTEHTKSFNLATPGSWASETNYLFEQFLGDTVSSQVKFVFVEFQNVMAIRPDRLNDPKSRYYQNYNNLQFITAYSFEEALKDYTKIPKSLYVASSHYLAAIQNYLNIGRFNTNSSGLDLLAHQNTDQRGFLSLSKSWGNRSSITRQQMESYISNINLHYKSDNSNPNTVFLSKCLSLINKSKKRGIKVIYVLPPVKITTEMISVFNALPEMNKVSICDPNEYPEIYKLDHWADQTHLKLSGAQILTKSLVDKTMPLK